MDEFERRVRDSLRSRAEDVAVTPTLWQEVQARHERRRRMVWLGAASGVVAAALVAGVAVPAVLDRVPVDRSPDVLVSDEPTDPRPTEAEPTPQTSDPVVEPTTPAPSDAPATSEPVSTEERYTVVTDGRRIALLDATSGEELRTLYEQPSEESEIVSVAARPGSTREDLTVVFLSQGEGMWFLRYLTVDGGEHQGVEQFPTGYDVSSAGSSVESGVVPAPVWSPDGQHLAWVESSDDGPVLRAIGWTDGWGPGTGDTADDNAGWTLDVAPASGFRLEDWVWNETSADTAFGTIWATDDEPAAYAIDIERQGDGALAMTGTTPRAFRNEEPIVDLGGSAQLTWQLVVAGGGEGTIDVVLVIGQDRTDLPPELTQTTDPSGYWLAASDVGAVVGLGGEARFVTPDGVISALPGRVIDATVLD